MTKVELAEKIRTGTNLSKCDSLAMLEALFSIMKRTLEDGESLMVSGFGSFIVKQKKDRLGRNPQTGEALTIQARRVVSFKPSALLRKAVNT